MRRLLVAAAAALLISSVLAGTNRVSAAGSETALVTTDHIVHVKSTAPAIAGERAELYVREKRLPGKVPTGAALDGKVVLFVHGAGTPAEVAFDVPLADYSWMGFLARAGFDVFAVDMTGYGRSTRPPQMNTPCNLAPDAQQQFVGRVIPAPCAPTFTKPTSTLASDWDDVASAVEYVRNLRHVAKINLFGWSMGGPRAAGWAAQHQDEVAKLVLLAPAYNRGGAARGAGAARADAAVARGNGGGTSQRARGAGAARAAFNTQSRDEFIQLWNRQAPCPGQYTPEARDAVWKEMLASDRVGAKWGTGVRRAPTGAGGSGAAWTRDMAAKTMIPTLLVSGEHDGQVNPQNVRNLFEDLGAKHKVFIDLACSSHNAMWEKNHLLLFQASLDWLTKTSIDGLSNGMVKLGYGGK